MELGHLPASEVIPPFAADAGENYFDAFPLLLEHELLGGGDQVGIETAAQPAIGGHEHQFDFFDLFGDPEEGMGLRLHPGGHAGQHLPEGGGIRAKLFHPRLGPTQLGRRYHIHGLGDLLRLFNRRDLPS